MAMGHNLSTDAEVTALTFKGGQEGVVDVDGMLGVPRAEVLAEDLHVPRQHKQVYIHLLQQRFNLRLLHNPHPD